jgi:hypothetical protein
MFSPSRADTLGGYAIRHVSIRHRLSPLAQWRNAVWCKLSDHVLTSLALAHFGCLLRAHVQTTPEGDPF